MKTKEITAKASNYALTFLLVTIVTFLVTSCGNDNPPVIDYDKIETETEASTNDAMAETLHSRTFVFPYTYKNSAKALVARITNKATTFDESVATAIIHDGSVTSLSDDDVRRLMNLLAGGGCLIYCEPSLDGVNTFFKALKNALCAMRKDGTLKITETGLFACRYIDALSENADGKIDPLFGYDGDSDGTLCDLVAICGTSHYIITDLDDINTIYVTTSTDGKVSESYEEQSALSSPTDYIYGVHVDALAKWIDNIPSQEEMLTRGYDFIHHSSTNSECQDLEQITNAQQVTYSFNAYAGSRTDPITVSYEIWAVNDKKGNDFYLIHQEVRCENSKTHCGPEASDHWVSATKYFPECGKKIAAYYAYMSKVGTQTEFSDKSAVLEHVSPSNSISGQTSYTEDITWSLEGAIVATKTPSAKLTGGVKISKSWTYDIPDLGMTFSYNGNKPKWEYVAGILPKTHDHGMKMPTHDTAKPIMRTDCTIGHSWIWKIGNATGTYSFKSNVWIDLQGLWIDLQYCRFRSSDYKTFSNEDTRSISLLPPPRYEQEWIMELVPYKKETADFLAMYFPNYWGSAFSIYTVEENDRDGIDARIDSITQVIEQNKSVLKNAGITEFTLNWKPLHDSNIYKSYKYSYK